MIIRISKIFFCVLSVILMAFLWRGNNHNIAFSQISTPTPPSLDSKPQVLYDEKGIPMVFVPSGTFQMGFTEEQEFELCKTLRPDGADYPCIERQLDILPPSTVAVESFYIDQFEVSLEAYSECVQADVCITDPSPNQPPEPTTLPIRLVNYYDAAVYCAWRGGRLPTEAEWEYAARGPEGLVFPWGNEFDGNNVNFCDTNCAPPSNLANYLWDDGYTGTAPIDTLPEGQSWVGAYHMAGNLAEWTSTRIWSDDRNFRLVDFRVLKGGTYLSYAHHTAGWTRLVVQAEFGQEAFGFRCIRTSNPQS
ncbi:MAG: formylglycine-generating enzyme family protein [Anaerolineae bacterium]|nr:formylglycine-generating enzyme family protein [Anaerolineae bacterium]